MTGIFIFGLIAIWGSIALMFSQWLRGSLPDRWWKSPVCSVLSVLFFLLPIGDEIVGGFQFRALCAKNDAIQTESEKIKGKTVRPVVNPSREEIQSHLIKIYYTHVSYRDVESNEELASYSRYEAVAGLLKRAVSALTGMPLSTGASACSNAPLIKHTFNQVNY
jgi:hypothetical protein